MSTAVKSKHIQQEQVIVKAQCKIELDALALQLEGQLLTDESARRAYANDASIYEQLPLAVAIPKSESDIAGLIVFAKEQGMGLIPRTAGTSLAGQVVGSGIVVDVSRHFTKIININPNEQSVTVQPGVIRDELNQALEPHALFFAPETSTSNRAMIGGMLGNNSCGANSIEYGTTRDHILEVTGFLSDGSRATFRSMSSRQFAQICDSNNQSLEAEIYRQINAELSSVVARDEIKKQFPKPAVTRRNTGYAIDRILDSEPFGGGESFNFSRLIAGSEGTLFFATEIKLRVLPIPTGETKLLCAHFESVEQSLHATGLLMQHQPVRCELIDDQIIQGARKSSVQHNRLGFIQGTPKAILLVEFRDRQELPVAKQIEAAVDHLKREGLGDAFPVLENKKMKQAWEVRKAGLGVLLNIPGKTRPTTVIEDMAVALEDLPSFIKEVNITLSEKFNVSCVYYGHIGAGELHLRPNLDLSVPNEVSKLREISLEMAAIVKRFRGSLSGEHGDGRLRSEHLKFMVGDHCFEIIKRIKTTWDPNGVFNPGKIVNAWPMDKGLRSQSMEGQPETIFHYRREGSLLDAAKMCSGSGDCRKTHLTGGTMCPSYMATRNESDTTRARANLLRQMLSKPETKKKLSDSGDLQEILDVLDLCLSCKGCKSECPSNVDMAKIKSEVTQMQFKRTGTPWKPRLLAAFESTMQRWTPLKPVLNVAFQNSLFGSFVKWLMGIHRNRSLPKIATQSVHNWFGNRKPNRQNSSKQVLFFCDEFTNHFDAEIGIAAIELFEMLGYQVELADAADSGRSAISVGMVEEAKRTATKNIQRLAPLVSDERKLVGIEPSAVLTFRDEYLDLVDDSMVAQANLLAKNTMLIDEFFLQEIQAGRIAKDQFRTVQKPVLLHLHCHQKALSSVKSAEAMLELVSGQYVETINSGCCGLAGFFGYDRTKFDLSIQIGELVLFPSIKNRSDDIIVCATGHSCRHQILDGTGCHALHPVQLLRRLIKE